MDEGVWNDKLLSALLLLPQQHLIDVHVQHFKLNLLVTHRILQLLLWFLSNVCRIGGARGCCATVLVIDLLLREHGVRHLGQTLFTIIFSQCYRVLVVTAPCLAERLRLVVTQHRGRLFFLRLCLLPKSLLLDLLVEGLGYFRLLFLIGC